MPSDYSKNRLFHFRDFRISGLFDTKKKQFFNRQYHWITSQYNVPFKGEQAY
ncbi:MAG: hypothetical protein ABI045_06755 [Flavobacteriales bacterium]